MPRPVDRLLPRSGQDQDLARIVNDLLDTDLAGAIVKIVDLASGLNRVAHGGGRTPVGFVATSHTVGVAVTDDGGHTDRYLNVRATGGATGATLLIFF